MRSKKSTSDQMQILKVTGLLVVPILTFVGGMITNAWGIAEKVATKPYVDESIAGAKKYTDERVELVKRDAELIRKDAYEHSDANKAQMLSEFSKMQGDQREFNGKVDSTLQSVVRAVQDLQNKRSR